MHPVPGVHGRIIYLRREVDDFQLGKEVGIAELDNGDYQNLERFVGEFAGHFGYDAKRILERRFAKLFSLYLRPYGKLYAY